MPIHGRIICLDCCSLPFYFFIFLSHSLRIKPISQQIRFYFPLVIFRFILESSPENHKAHGSALVDNLCQERPRLKYGFLFLFFCYHEGHISSLWTIATQKRRQKRLCIDLEALVCCFMNDDIEYDAPDKKHSYISSEKPNFKKKRYTQAAHIISQQTLLSQKLLGMHTISLSILCTLVCVYRISFCKLFYMRFKLFKNKISLYVKKVVWGKKKTWHLNVNTQYLSLEMSFFSVATLVVFIKYADSPCVVSLSCHIRNRKCTTH